MKFVLVSNFASNTFHILPIQVASASINLNLSSILCNDFIISSEKEMLLARKAMIGFNSAAINRTNAIVPVTRSNTPLGITLSGSTAGQPDQRSVNRHRVLDNVPNLRITFTNSSVHHAVPNRIRKTKLKSVIVRPPPRSS